MRRDLVGRSRETELVLRWAREPGALLTLTGPPGVGKTAIARAACRILAREGSRILFVRLAGAQSSEDADALVADRVAELSSDGLLAQTTDAFGVPGWARAVGQLTSPLLVLDGCESNLSLANRISELFLEASDGAVLVTSRERLGASGEEVLRVPPLETGPAIELLGYPTEVEEVRAELGEIATRVDNLPAALLLYAGVLENATPHQLVERLRRIPNALALDDIVRTSWEPLDPELKHLLVVASSFESLVTLELLEATVEPHLASRALLLFDQLARKSLVLRLRDVDGDLSPRFRVLAVVRAFVLSAPAVDPKARKAIEERFVAYVERSPARIAQHAQDLLYLVERRLRSEEVDSTSMRALHLLATTLRFRGEYRRVGDLIEGTLALAPPSPLATSLRAQLANALVYQLRPKEAFAHAGRVIEECRAHDDDASKLTGWLTAADIHSRLMQTADAQHALEQASKLARGTGDLALVEVLAMKVRVEWQAGTLQRSRDAAEAALPFAERVGMAHRVCVLRMALAQGLVAAGEWSQAARLAEQVVSEASSANVPALEAVAHTTLGMIYALSEELERAASSFETAYRQATTMGRHREALWALTYLGVARFLMGDPRTTLEEAALRTHIDEPVLLLVPLFATIAGSTLARSLLDDGLERLQRSYGKPPWLERLSAAATACQDRRPDALEPLAAALPPAFQPDLRLCRAMLSVKTRSAEDGPTRLRIAEDASWFALGTANPTPIGASPTARRILSALVAAHSGATPTLTLEALHQAAWPGDKSRRDSAANRVYVALSRLRDRGLRDAIERDASGWRLRKGTQVEIVPQR
jgi:tetratricopeptide (TPR) repeat protein